MASKFFSRSKTDRKTALWDTPPMGGLISINTTHLDSKHTKYPGKTPHRPKPLDLSISTHNIYTASVLHDAAVNSVSSASNLLAVVNDMLKSPLLVGHHKPLPPRPRANTAPPTPDIAELPGSAADPDTTLLPRFPFELNGSSVAGGRVQRPGLLHKSSIITARTAPPLTAPMDSSFPPLPEIRMTRASSVDSAALPTDSRLTLCSQVTNPRTSVYQSSPDMSALLASTEMQPAHVRNDRLSVGSPRIPLGQRSTSYGGHVTRPSLTSVRSFDGSQRIEELTATLTAQKHTISTLTDQFTSLKSSHDAHINSLMDAHVNEMESLKRYIEGLEQQQAVPVSATRGHNAGRLGSVSKEIQAGSPQAITAPPVKDFRNSKEEDQVRREYSKLKRKIETANTQTIAIMTQLENARKQESAYRNEVQALEGRLEEANAEKVDALEAAYSYEAEIRQLRKRQKSLIKENEDMRVEAVQTQTQGLVGKLQDAEATIQTLGRQLKQANERRPEEDAITAFVRQIESLETNLRDKESQRCTLEKENKNIRDELDDAETRLRDVMKVNEKLMLDSTHGELSKVKKENIHLKTKCAKTAEVSAKVQSDAEEYYRLLKQEIKRKACKRQQCLEDGHLDPALYPLTLTDISTETKERLLSKEANETRSKAAAILGLNEKSKDLSSQLKILEIENDYHVRDIVAYRIVVRDYEREARKFSARLKRRDDLLQQYKQQIQQQRDSPTNSSERNGSTGSNSSSSTVPALSNSTSPRTPQTNFTTPRTPQTAAMTPLSMRTAKQAVSGKSHPTKSLKPSLSIHKRLPIPPPMSPPETSMPDYVHKRPMGLGIISQTPVSPRTKAPLTPVREVSIHCQQQKKKSRRTMSESVISFPYPSVPSLGSTQPKLNQHGNGTSPANGSARRPSLPTAEITSADTPDWMQARKAAVRANVLARAEAEERSSSNATPPEQLAPSLRYIRSKQSIDGKNDGIQLHSSASPPVFSLRGLNRQSHGVVFGQRVKGM